MKHKINKNDYIYEQLFRTRDLAEASFLIAKDKVLEDVDNKVGIYWFVFQNKKTCEKLVNEFWFGKSVVNARKFYEANKLLKDRIFGRGGRT